MTQLPVGKTIIDAYRFTFINVGTIIGLIWFPLVLLTLLNFLPQLAGNVGGDTSSALAVGTLEVETVAVSLLTLLLYAIIYVVVIRQALGLRTGPATFHFALSQAEFRMFGAVLGVGLVLLAVLLLCVFLVAGAATAASSQGAAGPAAALPILMGIAGACALVYVIVRLGFLVAPVTVVESHIDLGRGWKLTRGNFWRIFAVVLAIVVPLSLVECAGVLALMGSEFAAALPPPGTVEPHILQQHMAALEAIVERHMPELMGIGLILAPFNLGLSLSASAFAYRSLSASAEDTRKVTA